MSAGFVVYMCLLWYATTSVDQSDQFPVKHVEEKGLSAAELEKLPQITGKELMMGTECAVCLEEIDRDELARLVPGCNHGFHLLCADTWLSKQSVCPVCRTNLQPEISRANENPC